jgi:uncharacterized protein involved in cysteine biosynthesis
MHEFLTGIKDYLRAERLVREHRMWPLLCFPGLVSLIYFPAILFLTFYYVDDAAVYVRDNWLPVFLKQKVFLILVVAAWWTLGLYLGFILFRNVIMIFYAPVLGFLSAKTEENAGVSLQSAVAKTNALQATVRGVGMSLISLGLSLASLTFCLLLLLIPILGGLLITVLLAATQMFLAGHGFMDPALERRGYGVRQSFRFAWRNRLRVLGCGRGFALLTAIPLAGWFLGPTLGIVAGTLGAMNLVPDAEGVVS